MSNILPGVLPPPELKMSVATMAICLEVSPDKLLEDIRARDVLTLKLGGKHYVTLEWLTAGVTPKPYSETQDGRAKNGRRKEGDS